MGRLLSTLLPTLGPCVRLRVLVKTCSEGAHRTPVMKTL